MQNDRQVAAPAHQLMIILFLFVCAWVALPHHAAAADEDPPSGSSAAAVAFDGKVRAIGAKLRCPVCEGQSIAESHSEVAIEMRQEIMRRLLAGESEEEILDAFVEVWGPSILMAPPRQGGYLVAWLGPVLLVLVGVWFLWRFLRWPRAVAGNADIPTHDPIGSDDTSISNEKLKLKRQVEERLREYL